MRTTKSPRSRPLTLETQERLYAALEAMYPGNVWRVIEVQPVAVITTIDNEDDALRTLANIERKLAEHAQHPTCQQ